MNNEFLDIARKSQTIDEFLNLVPNYIGWKTNISEMDLVTLRYTMDNLTYSKRELLERRFIEDISEYENRLLVKICNFVDTLILAKDQNNFESPEMATYIVDKFLEDARQLIIRAEHATNTLAIPTPNFSQAPAPNEPILLRHLFSNISDQYVAERLSGNNWEKKTHNSYLASFKIFQDIFGDIAVSEINSDVCREFKSKLIKIPKNHSKTAKYRELSIQKLLDLDIPKESLISTESVNKHIGRVSSLFNWCVQQSYMDKNFLDGMIIRVKKSRQNQARQPFSSQDLNILFSDPIFTMGKMHRNYYFWLPLIALYSGARIQEICQLELKDIRSEHGILVFDINNKSDHARLKNNSSARLIPVHKTLIDIGLERYIKSLSRRKHKVLFPELVKNASGIDGQSQPASKWFARYKSKHGFPTDSVKAFHSFRHSFVDQLKGIGTPEHITAAIVGHAHGGITYAVYGSDNPISLLDKHLQNIKYEGFDYSAIKWFPK
jgi:integrase